MDRPNFQDQLFSPGHCYLQRADGSWFTHSLREDRDSPPNPLKGKPVRFTRIAAERVLVVLEKNYGVKLKIVPEEEINASTSQGI